jgi:hypothetical protein
MLFVGCASSPALPPVSSTKTVQVLVPTPVPCVTEAERPVPPSLTTIDLKAASVDQKVAALARDVDAINRDDKIGDALLAKCVSGGTAP